MVTEQQVRKVPVTTCRMVYEERVEQVPYQVCRMVAEQQTIRVPHCVEKRIPVTYTYNVPRLVCYRVPLDACGNPIVALLLLLFHACETGVPAMPGPVEARADAGEEAAIRPTCRRGLTPTAAAPHPTEEESTPPTKEAPLTDVPSPKDSKAKKSVYGPST